MFGGVLGAPVEDSVAGLLQPESTQLNAASSVNARFIVPGSYRMQDTVSLFPDTAGSVRSH
ncbi:MAG: hypothetical protein ACI835_002461 [Planctomycetota bacterium]|jgi:hypothetical protein